MSKLKRGLGLNTAILVVVSSMVGSGIFFATGKVVEIIPGFNNIYLILLFWFICGVIAVASALSYAELSTIYPNVGGEYIYLREIFGLLPSFLIGWISLVVGFSAPLALNSLVFVDHFNQLLYTYHIEILFDKSNQIIFACITIITMGIFHILGVKLRSFVQNSLKLFKII